VLLLIVRLSPILLLLLLLGETNEDGASSVAGLSDSQ
jgi:hypothetical protein